MSTVTIILFAALAYFGTVAASTLLSHPLRLRLAELADQMAEEHPLSKEEQYELEWMIHSSTSTVIGLALPAAALYLFVSSALGAPKGPPLPRWRHLDRDPRYRSVKNYYVLSVMACNPFATLLAVPSIAAFVLLNAWRGNDKLVDAAESPFFKASATFRTC